MKNREIKIWGTIGCIIVIALMVWILTGNNCNSPAVVQPVDSTFYWKNKYHQEVASLKGFAIQFQLKEKKLADSLADVYNTKAKWLQEWVLAFTETRAELKPVEKTKEEDYHPPVVINGVECPPQVKRMRQSFSHPYYDAQVQLGDSSYLLLQGRDSISVLWKIVKEGRLFNRRTLLQLDVSLANPDTRVTGLKAFRAGPLKPKRLGLGFQVGYQFTGKEFRPYFGVGASYNFIRL